MGYKLNGCDTSGVPFYLIKPIMEIAKINYFIELGTAGGGSIIEAAKVFKKCETIEVVEDRAKINPKIKNIIWHTGKTIDVLPSIVEKLVIEKEELNEGAKATQYNYALFWMDAHYSDPEPNESDLKECYILEELEIISRYHNDSILIIDDARLFLGHPPHPNNPQDWAGIQDIFCLLKEKFPHNYSTITDDYIISLPSRLRVPLDAEWRSRFNIRYPSAEDKLKSETRNVFKEFQNYIK